MLPHALLYTIIFLNFLFNLVQTERKKKFSGKIKRVALDCNVCGAVIHGTFNMKRHMKIKHKSVYSTTTSKLKKIISVSYFQMDRVGHIWLNAHPQKNTD